jgi:hypothetical protein
MQLPTEIINHILSFRPKHPTAKMIEDLLDPYAETAYENWGGNFPTDDEEEEGELELEYIRTRTLYQNLYDCDYFLKRAPTLVYNSTTGKIYENTEEEYLQWTFAVFNKRVVYDYNMEIHPLLD